MNNTSYNPGYQYSWMQSGELKSSTIAFNLEDSKVCDIAPKIESQALKSLDKTWSDNLEN